MLEKLKIDPGKLKIGPPKLKLDPAVRVRLKARFRAWWEGYEFDPAAVPEPAPEDSLEGKKATKAPMARAARAAPAATAPAATAPAATAPAATAPAATAPAAAVPSEQAPAAFEPKPEADEDDEDTTSEKALCKGRRATTWHEPRVLVCEAIWGYGLILPGGVETPLAWLKPLGLNSKKTLLHVGAGLGGVTRAIAKTLGVWVTGIEDRSAFVEGAMELSTMAGLGKKAPVKLFHPARPELASFGKFNAVFVQECLWRMPERPPLLSEIHDATRKRGHLVVVDYVRGKDAPAYAAWQQSETLKEELWSLDDLAKALTDRGYNVRIAESIKAAHMAQIEHALATYCRRLRPSAMDKIMAGAVLGELEQWNRRLVALRAGGLDFCRIDAIRKE